jgi:hypothetical protein
MTRRDLPHDARARLAALPPDLAEVAERIYPTEERDREVKRTRAIRQNVDAKERRERRAALVRECLEGKHGKRLRDFSAGVERQYAGLTDEAVEVIMRALNEHRKGRQ